MNDGLDLTRVNAGRERDNWYHCRGNNRHAIVTSLVRLGTKFIGSPLCAAQKITTW
jgi:hypothetical protein